jgi:ribosome-associated protein
LEDVKGQNILVFDTCEKSNFFDCVVIASGISNRQTRALAKSVVEKLKKTEGINCRLEGEDNGEWVLVDCGDIICHVMQPVIREYYNLEELWGSKSLSIEKIKDSFVNKQP